MANFIALCYATAKKAGKDTNKMTPDEVVEWYNKQQGRTQAKGKAIEISKNYFDNKEKREFKCQLEQVQDGSFDKEHTQLKLGHTPNILKDKAGLPDLPLVMSYETAYLSMNKTGNVKGNYHDLGIDIMEQIPDALEKPAYILKSDKNKRIEAVLELKDKKQRDIFVSIEFDTTKNVDSKYKNVNLMITAFGAKDSYIQKRLLDKNIVYKRKNQDAS